MFEDQASGCSHHPLSSVYVFVNSPLSLFLSRPHANDVDTIQVASSQPLLIPCRSSYSGIQASLYRVDKKSDRLTQVSVGPATGSHYDARVGFQFRRFAWDPETTAFLCRGSVILSDGSVIKDEYEVHLMPSRSSGPLYPFILPSNRTIVVQGDSFSLDCRVSIESGSKITAINWDRVVGGDHDGVVMEGIKSRAVMDADGDASGDQRRMLISRRIHVMHANISDEGAYECSVIGSDGRSYTRSADVRVIPAIESSRYGTSSSARQATPGILKLLGDMLIAGCIATCILCNM